MMNFKKRQVRSLTAAVLVFAMILGSCFTAFANGAPTPVTYLDEDGNQQSCTTYTLVTGSTSNVTWNAGWYVVDGNVTLSDGATCNGEVHLILKDGSKLTATGKVGSNTAGINVSGSNKLTIYAQSIDEAAMGQLEAKGGTKKTDGGNGCAGIGGKYTQSGCNITINGGKITAEGAVSSAGIGGGDCGGSAQNITINGGVITAKGSGAGAGIGGGWLGSATNIKINGGKLTATGNTGIGKGSSGSNGSKIYASEDIEVKAGTDAASATVVAHTATDDISASVAAAYVATRLTKVPLTVTPAAKRYDGKPAEWTAKSSLAGAVIKYQVSTDKQATWSSETAEKPVLTDVGEYYVKVKASATGYTDNVKTVQILIKDTHLLTYMLDGTKKQEVEVASGSTVTKPADPEKEGHTFSGWFTDKDLTVPFKFDGEEGAVKVLKDTVLYGKMYPYNTVTFDMQGYGEQVKPIKVASGSTAEKPDDPEAGGMIFSGWFKDKAFTNEWDWDEDVVRRDITLYAKWITAHMNIPASGGTSYARPVKTGTWNDPVTDGTWSQNADGSWSYTTNTIFRSTWGYIRNPYAKSGQAADGWYYFDANGKMLTGWQQINGSWYYLNTVSDGTRGMCLLNTLTPDGYRVDANGVAMKDANGNWIRK